MVLLGAATSSCLVIFVWVKFSEVSAWEQVYLATILLSMFGGGGDLFIFRNLEQRGRLRVSTWLFSVQLQQFAVNSGCLSGLNSLIGTGFNDQVKGIEHVEHRYIFNAPEPSSFLSRHLYGRINDLLHEKRVISCTRSAGWQRCLRWQVNILILKLLLSQKLQLDLLLWRLRLQTRLAAWSFQISRRHWWLAMRRHLVLRKGDLWKPGRLGLLQVQSLGHHQLLARVPSQPHRLHLSCTW